VDYPTQADITYGLSFSISVCYGIILAYFFMPLRNGVVVLVKSIKNKPIGDKPMQISSMGGSALTDMLQQMQQKMQTSFSNTDTDGDGKLSKTEFSAFDAAMKADAPQGTQGADGKTMPSTDEMFSKLDTDGDGSVTLTELENNAPQPPISADGMSTLLQLQEADSSTTNPLMKAFKAADADGDGQLSETEFEAFDDAMKAQATGAGSTPTETATTDTDDTTQTAAAGGGGSGGGDSYDKLDTNKDGVVSAQELAAANDPMSSSSSGDLISSLIQRLISNYSQGGDDMLSSMLGTTA
jgi:Ca2+-binding EF-hand superfamily protein